MDLFITKRYKELGMGHLIKHRKIAVTCGTIAWLWMMWRASKDGDVVMVCRLMI